MPRWLTLKYCELIFWINSDAHSKHKGSPRIAVMYKTERGSVFNLQTGEVIKSEDNSSPLKPREIALAQEVICKHQEELSLAWNQLASGEKFDSIFFHHENQFKKWI